MYSDRAMSWLDRVRNFFKQDSIASGTHYGARLSTYKTAIGSVQRARLETVIHAGVRIIAHTIASCRWYSDSDDVDRLLDNPNSAQTQFEWISAIVHALLFYGKAPQRVIRSNNVSSLVPMEPENVRMQVSDMGVVSYEYTKSQRRDRVKLSEDEVCYLVDLPTYNVEEISRVQAAITRIESLVAADNNIKSCFDNGITASWIITQEGPTLDDDATKEFARAIKQQLSNTKGDRTGGLLILGRGMKAERVQTGSPADSDLRDLREDYIREIAAALGTPPFIIGGAGDTKYNNVSARMTGFFKDTLSPLITNIEQRVSKTVNAKVKCDTADLEAGDLRSQIEIINKATAGKAVWTQNEARDKLGMKRVDEESADVLGSDSGSMQEPEEAPTDTGRGDGPDDE